MCVYMQTYLRRELSEIIKWICFQFKITHLTSDPTQSEKSSQGVNSHGREVRKRGCRGAQATFGQRSRVNTILAEFFQAQVRKTASLVYCRLGRHQRQGGASLRGTQSSFWGGVANESTAAGKPHSENCLFWINIPEGHCGPDKIQDSINLSPCAQHTVKFLFCSLHVLQKEEQGQKTTPQ